MVNRRSAHTQIVAVSGLVFLLASANLNGQILIDHTCTDLEAIPDFWIQRVVDRLHIAYNYTCPGSQIVSGMNALESFPPYGSTFEWSDDGSSGLDFHVQAIPCTVSDLGEGDFLDENGVTPWVTCTREFLNSPEHQFYNVVMWSWCSINGHDAQRYVDNMEILISEYPDTRFIFMTGRAQGQGENSTPGSVHFNNQLIRQHCMSHGRILFDFGDIEAYDPTGTYFWDLDMWNNLDYSGGNWAEDWITSHPESVLAKLTTGAGVPGYDGCTNCDDSDSPQARALNCVLKARAAWWMFSVLAGWHEGVLPAPLQPSGRIAPQSSR